MKNMMIPGGRHKVTLLALAFPLLGTYVPSQASTILSKPTEMAQQQASVLGIRKINPTTVEVRLTQDQRVTFDFYGETIFRLFRDQKGGILRDPIADPAAQILVNQPRKPLSKLVVQDETNQVTISTSKIKLSIGRTTGLLQVVDLRTGRTVIEESMPILFEKNNVVVSLKEQTGEYFYGGGVQNGRFSHKGKTIAIVNQNSWTDGGVASPNPFYWSTAGYGMMWYTFKPGKYDFGSSEKGMVKLSHETSYLDLFFMIDEGPVALLNDFYQLTGHPVLLPKFGFYEGHLNAYNRDYWKEDPKGVLFEDGKRYKESQKDNGGTKESLNGEKNNYQFSARAVIDRYRDHDMPLGWLLPNDGYGAGYGQTETLDGNIQNLKSLGDYARKNGVEIGLWTQSDLHPKAGISALLQRDIVKEVRDAGVRVLKTDVAWVGSGYSFGLNGVADVGHIMPYYGNDARPFIISLDGWAGTQRYAGIWSGDQTGGVWEYIRFHIPTYIGSGLSGQPNICSDMDGIFGGKNAAVNIRDFQWKTFSPMQLNMDGWGANEKYPHALGEPASSINRTYLKLKSELLPYAYSYAKQAVDGLPLIRAMFLDDPNAYTYGTATQYQFMYGQDFLVAPIYQETKADQEGNDIRNGIYLPKGRWVDYFSGELYDGGVVINSFEAPIWKLPVFVKAGAIIPMVNPNNNVKEIDPTVRIYECYPYGHSQMMEYDDDGRTEAYRYGQGCSTWIESDVDQKQRATLTIHPSQGSFDEFVTEKATVFRVNVTQQPKRIAVKMNGKTVKLTAVSSLQEWNDGTNVFFYEEAPELNRFATPDTPFAKVKMTKNPVLHVKLAAVDVTSTTVQLRLDGYRFEPTERRRVTDGTLVAPRVEMVDANVAAYTVKPTWEKVAHADYYEVEFNGMLYTTIKDTELLFDGLDAETTYTFKVRAVNREGESEWSECRVTTKSNPLQFAIHGLKGETTCLNQYESLYRLFDFEESGDTWHTKYRVNAIPFDMTVDLCSVNTIDKFHYLPRKDGANGIILKGTVSYSLDKIHWTEAGAFEWKRTNETKVFSFANRPTARYIRLNVTEAVGNYGSGRELYVFKVPGTESWIPGDINSDGKIDENDLTSYTNYTGLRQGDSDFEGYISIGDINKNGLIDAYDISNVTTRLEGGASTDRVDSIGGKLTLQVDRTTFKKDELIEIRVKGADLHAVNAFSFALPYDQTAYEYIGFEPIGIKNLENLIYDRLHTSGQKALYPTFVNIGDKEALNGTSDLFVLKFRAKHNLKFNLKAIDGMVVDKNLNICPF